MAGIFAPKSGQGVCDLGCSARGGRERLSWRQRVEVCTGRSAWLIRAIGTVAAVVIDLGGLEGDGWMADTCERISSRVELGNCTLIVSFYDYEKIAEVSVAVDEISGRRIEAN
jgi:hypothetical protein